MLLLSWRYTYSHPWRPHNHTLLPQLTHALPRYISSITIFLFKPSTYYNTKHVKWINNQKYLFPFCCWIEANLFEMGIPPSIYFKWRPLFRWSVLLMHHSAGRQPWPDHMLMTRSIDLHSRRKPKWYLRWSGTLVWIARADRMAVRDWAWMTKLQWTRATNWCR
jgi:hypothetical protein